MPVDALTMYELDRWAHPPNHSATRKRWNQNGNNNKINGKKTVKHFVSSFAWWEFVLEKTSAN